MENDYATVKKYELWIKAPLRPGTILNSLRDDFEVRECGPTKEGSEIVMITDKTSA